MSDQYQDDPEARRIRSQAQQNMADYDAAHSPEALRQAQMEREIAAFKTEARARYPGNSDEFEQDWPDILKTWKAEKAMSSPGTPRQRVRL